MNTKPILFILFSIILTSCEGYVHIRGIVKDDETKLPLEDVSIYCKNYRQMGILTHVDSIADRKKGVWVGKTDSLGQFELKSGFIGMVFPMNFKLSFHKDLYKIEKNKKDTLIYLKKK